jgi:hypothetical protein
MAHDPFLPGQPVDPDRINELDVQGTYTPVLTATGGTPNLGSTGTADGTWWRSGHWLQVFARFLFSGTGIATGGGGVFHVSLPFQPDLSLVDANPFDSTSLNVGYGWIRDSSAGSNTRIVTVQLRQFDVTGLIHAQMRQPGLGSGVSGTSPFTVADNDRIGLNFAYPMEA